MGFFTKKDLSSANSENGVIDEIELPTFSYKPIRMTSSLERRKKEEERFKETGAEKEKMFDIL